MCGEVEGGGRRGGGRWEEVDGGVMEGGEERGWRSRRGSRGVGGWVEKGVGGADPVRKGQVGNRSKSCGSFRIEVDF